MVEEAPASPRLFRWGGMAIVVAGVLMVVATLLHPSRETTATIIASEPRLVAAHALYTLAWLLILLGLPGLYSAQREGMGRLGLTGFLFAMFGTYLIAVTGYFGFLAPVLAEDFPAAIAAIGQYTPVVISNGLAAIAFMVGYALFGIAMISTATLPRWSGRARCSWRSCPSDRVRHFPACLNGRMGGRRPRGRESWSGPWLAGLSPMAHTFCF
jgi:hypothetical protein